MPRPYLNLSANLSFLFCDVPFADRFARAARAGFRGVEYLFRTCFPTPTMVRTCAIG